MRESFRIAIIRRALHERSQVDDRKRAVSRAWRCRCPPRYRRPVRPASPGAAAPAATKSFSQEELDQLLAPIALYPDALLAQVLMASTYPLEIVQAERWVKANPRLKDKALEDALQKQPWDPTVKSLAVFPQVLTMMSEKLDWTQKLGDAFLAQQKEVMATAQALRAQGRRARHAQGLEGAEGRHRKSENNTTIIKIEPTNPEVVYVPTYNPTVVYGAWPYPGVSAVLLLSARLRRRRRAARLHRRRHRRRRAVGQLQLGRRRRQHQRQPLQQLQHDQHLERQLEAQRRSSRRGAVSRQGASRSSTTADSRGDAASRERFAAAPTPGVSRSSAATCRRATSRAAICGSRDAGRAGGAAAVVTSAGATRSGMRSSARSTPAAARRRAISAIAARRA